MMPDRLEYMDKFVILYPITFLPPERNSIREASYTQTSGRAAR